MASRSRVQSSMCQPGNIFGKLGLELAEDDQRRVLAVLAYLKGPTG